MATIKSATLSPLSRITTTMNPLTTSGTALVDNSGNYIATDNGTIEASEAGVLRLSAALSASPTLTATLTEITSLT